MCVVINGQYAIKPKQGTVFPRIVSHVTLNETKRIWKIHFSKKNEGHMTCHKYDIFTTRNEGNLDEGIVTCL